MDGMVEVTRRAIVHIMVASLKMLKTVKNGPPKRMMNGEASKRNIGTIIRLIGNVTVSSTVQNNITGIISINHKANIRVPNTAPITIIIDNITAPTVTVIVNSKICGIMFHISYTGSDMSQKGKNKIFKGITIGQKK